MSGTKTLTVILMLISNSDAEGDRDEEEEREVSRVDTGNLFIAKYKKLVCIHRRSINNCCFCLDEIFLENDRSADRNYSA